ncbi:short-chain dehydrogenase [Virgibacillus kekensis]|uniref:Short-chain dehydrogenase n=1 Tax=Virgibacillus kekensis TaxID=202261 RepID=A0ABV9DJ97_9BACI
MKNGYVLVIGGSGMLRKVCHYLNEKNGDVFVIGRNRSRLEAVKNSGRYPERLHGISVDYEDSTRFGAALADLFNKHGTPGLVVSWIHSTAPDALPLLKDMITEHVLNADWRLFHIQGSARFFEKENTSVPGNCLYRRVYLGFILDNDQSRWLTHDEISNGVIEAIDSDQEETVVGTLEPWAKRP